MAGQVKDHGVGVFTGLISAGAVALIGELFKNAVSEGIKNGSIAFWLTMIAAALAMITAYVFAYNYSVIFREYGLDSADVDERAVFDGLKKRLAEGGRFVPVYNDLMTRALDRVDRFFGDADPAVKTLWPRAFGFKGNKPFWTAPAYDRCLLIALVYPIIIAIALGSDSMSIATLLVMLPIFMRAGFIFGKAVKAANFSRIVVGSALTVTGSLFAVGGSAIIIFFLTVPPGNFTFAATVTFSILVAVAVAVTIATAVATALAVASAFAVAIVITATVAGTGAFPVVLSFIGAVAIYFLNDVAQRQGKQILFWMSFSSLYLTLCYTCAYWFGETDIWDGAGVFFLFFGVLTLVNAPFDWSSIGLTRALLRRGVQAGGFAPLWLALVDLLAATFLLIVLAAVMVFAVDLFEVVGRNKIFGVDRTLAALADPAQRGQNKYWWIYATLFSTLIPSILNVTIAALSLMRGVPSFHKSVAAKMRPGKPMMEIHLIWMPAALAFEVMIAVLAGVAVTGWWIFKAVPTLARPVEWLVPFLQWVAALV